MKKALTILAVGLSLGLTTGCDEFEIEDVEIDLGNWFRPWYYDDDYVVVEEYYYDDYDCCGGFWFFP